MRARCGSSSPTGKSSRSPCLGSCRHGLRFGGPALSSSDELLLTLDDCETFEVDISGQAVPSGVPVVYLDQLHWISLAQHLWAPDRLRESEREAAETLIGLAREQRILLPVAGAHLTEIAPVAGRRRRELAATILGLCRGWQMQNPVRLRGQEYAASMLGKDPFAANAFTLEPGVLFTDGPTPPAPMPGAPPDLAEVLTRVIAISAVYSAMLDDEPLDRDEGKATAERWATSFPQLATYMREQRTSAEHARINARARLIADQRDDIARAAHGARVSRKRFAEWLADELPDHLERMPYFGRLGEVLYLRLRNADDKWEANDLNHMNFLCAAAGYADITVGEKRPLSTSGVPSRGFAQARSFAGTSPMLSSCCPPAGSRVTEWSHPVPAT